MVAPAALATISMGASAAGAGISAYGALQSGQAQSQMYQYQAGIAQLNKQIALQNADYAVATGETQARDYGMGAAQKFGAIRAAQGASGIDVGSGSTQDVQKGQKLATSIDLGTIRQNAARVAYGYETGAAQDEAQSRLYGMASKDAESAGRIKALGSLISGAASVSDKWLQMGQYGMKLGAG